MSGARCQPSKALSESMVQLLPSALIGAVASARSMTPMAVLAAARLGGRATPGQLMLLDRPLFKFGALAMGVGELFGDKMKTAPDRTVLLGLLARVMSAGIAGAALAPRGRERAGAAIAVASAVPLAYLTLSAASAGHRAHRSDPQRADRRPADRRRGRCRGRAVDRTEPAPAARPQPLTPHSPLTPAPA